MTKTANFDPTDDAENKALQNATRQLAMFFMPSVCDFELYVTQPKGLKWSKYNLNFKVYSYDRLGNPKVKLTPNLVMKNGSIKEKYNYEELAGYLVRQSDFTANTIEWAELSDEKYYFIYCVFNGDIKFRSDAVFEIEDMLFGENGESLLEWVGTRFADTDCMWGVPSRRRRFMTDTIPDPEIMQYMFKDNKHIRLLLDSGIYGDLSKVDVDKINFRSSKITAAVLYGKGSQLKTLADNPLLTLTNLTESHN